MSEDDYLVSMEVQGHSDIAHCSLAENLCSRHPPIPLQTSTHALHQEDGSGRSKALVNERGLALSPGMTDPSRRLRGVAGMSS